MKLIAWTIPGEGEAEHVVATIKLQPGDSLTPQHHLHLLTDRLQDLINKSDDPQWEAKMMEDVLREKSLLSGELRTYKTAAWDLLVGNQRFQELMHWMDIYRYLPDKPITETNKEAELILEAEEGQGLTQFLDCLIVP